MNNIIQDITTRRKLIDLFLKYPEREFTVNELARESGISYSTVWRFAQKLDKSGVIETRTIGHSRVCKLNKSSKFLDEIKKILKAKPTPQKAVINEFVSKIKRLKEVKKIILFGSVARDEEKLTSDIDVAVVATKKNKDLEKRISEIRDKILENSRMLIVPIVVTKKELKANKQFEDQVNGGKILYERG